MSEPRPPGGERDVAKQPTADERERAVGRRSAGGEGEARGSSGRSSAKRRPAQIGWPLWILRYGLPVIVTVAGLVIMALGSETDLEGGAGVVSAGLAIYFLNWLFRIGATGDREREAEEAARDYYTQHGRWPD